MYKYVFSSGNIQIRLDRLIPIKRRLNRVNGKRRVTDCLPFSVYENIDFEKSTLRQLNWSWLHPTLEKARILRLKKYSIAVAWSPTTRSTASIEKAATLWCNPGK